MYLNVFLYFQVYHFGILLLKCWLLLEELHFLHSWPVWSSSLSFIVCSFVVDALLTVIESNSVYKIEVTINWISKCFRYKRRFLCFQFPEQSLRWWRRLLFLLSKYWRSGMLCHLLILSGPHPLDHLRTTYRLALVVLLFRIVQLLLSTMNILYNNSQFLHLKKWLHPVLTLTVLPVICTDVEKKYKTRTHCHVLSLSKYFLTFIWLKSLQFC